MKAKRPLPTEVLTFTGEHLNNRGQFLAMRDCGTPARCYGTAPQDTALCMLAGKKRGARQCHLRTVLEPGPDRCEIICPHFGYCGGCTYQHIDYSAQVALKAAPVEYMLREQSHTAEILPAVLAPTPWYYRCKVEFSFIGDQLGFNIRGLFQRLINIEECFIGPPCNREVLAVVRNWQKKHAFIGWNPKTNSGFLRYLVIRSSSCTGEFLVTLVTATPQSFRLEDPGNPFQELAQELMQIRYAAGVLQVTHNGISPTTSAAESEHLLAGRDSIKEQVNSLEFSLGWRSFFQVNPPAYAHMLRNIRAWVGKQEKILDLYCGVGTIGLSMDGPVVGVESVPQAIEHAKRNAQRLHKQAEFYCANSEDWPSLESSLLILDPPRHGCHPKLIERVAQEGPSHLLYISCNYNKFFEEYQKLRQSYTIQKAQLYDFFPHTPHVETCVLLCRENIEGRKMVSVTYEPTDEEIVPILSPSATYAELKQWIEEKYHTKVSSLYIAQVKGKHGLEMRENFNKPKSPNAKQPVVPVEKEKMIEDALRHFRMIE